MRRPRARWLGFLGAGLALLVALAFGLAALLVDATRVADAVTAELAARLGARVECAAADVTWLPSPAVELSDVELRAEAANAPFLRAERMRLRVSLLALFAGKVALRSLEVVAPELRLELDADGVPVLPQLRSRSPRPFQRFFGVFELRDGRLEFSQLGLDQADASALLRGSYRLADENVDLVGEARYFVGPDFVAPGFRLAGPVDDLRASFDVPGAKDTPERRRTQRKMLQGMLETLAQSPEPDDPELAEQLRERIDHLESRLRKLEEEERAESSIRSATPYRG